ncbi:uncharacterized protein LOC119615525 [Lucilia sericata]|uniref:uncharacterized protein LOC119615525 n=1 Tax=Lucilia sericata TaxID=13632 RepID=UPI0018A84E83|nr:uncharacterized protein LOC119615525 [Lucilia sericata]
MSLFYNMEKQDLETLGLRIKLIIVDCFDHEYRKEIWNKYSPSYDSIRNLDVNILKEDKIYEYIRNTNFVYYSSIIIVINCYYYPCRARNLRLVIEAIERNTHLRYNLKVICTFYDILPTFYKKFNFETIKGLFLTDYYTFVMSNLENAFFFQDYHEKSGDAMLHNLLKILENQPFISAKELHMILKIFCAISVISKANVDLYFNNVNPALAIIINQYYFANHNTREGSEKDVQQLIQQFQISRTPYIVIQDFKRSEILKLIEFLSCKDLSALMCLYFITMTHGMENNIIYASDTKVNFIEDILNPIQSNVFLKDTHITFVNVHCRGSIDAAHMDHDDSENILPTKIEQLQPNVTVFYSVPDLVTSPRCTKSGTPFINSYCKVYLELKCSSNIEKLYEKITNVLKKNNYYYGNLDCCGKSAELVVADKRTTNQHCIKPLSTSALTTVPCFQSIRNEVPALFHQDHNNIINAKNKDQTARPFSLYTNDRVNKLF